MAYTTEIGLKDFYKQYKETSIKRNRVPVSYKVFSNILKDFNKELRTKVIYDAETFDLPYRLGRLGVKKFRNVYKQENKKNWSVNFKETKEKGYVVYHAAEFGYRWIWNKVYCRVPSRKFYSFKACRTASRLIADAIKNKKLDYYEVR